MPEGREIASKEAQLEEGSPVQSTKRELSPRGSRTSRQVSTKILQLDWQTETVKQIK